MIFQKEKMIIFRMFSNKSVESGAFILIIIAIAYNKPMDLCYRCYKLTFITYFLMRINTKI